MISIIIPLYNKEPYIYRTLESVLNQTYPDYEIVVVDDGSVDRGADIADNFEDTRIRIIRQANAGVSVARNRGIAEAKYDWIAFLDADDEWLPNHLACLVRLADNYPACGLCATSYFLQMNDGVRLEPHISPYPFEGKEGLLSNYYELASGTDFPFNMNSFMVRKEVILSIGGFPEGVKSGEDIITLARLFAVCDFAYSKEATSVYHLDTIGKNDRGTPVVGPLDLEFERLLKTASHRQGVRAYVAAWYKRRMAAAFLRKDYLSGFHFFFRSMRITPFYRKLYSGFLIVLIASLTGKNINKISNLFSKRRKINS